MLESLTIRRVALIEDVTIRFHDGMQVLTGETGAGKSIVVDSVNLILGGRADRDLIRSGYENATVEAVFDVRKNEKIQSFMDREEIEYDGTTVTVYREISVLGKNICRICGVILPISKLKELAKFLMDLHGQSEHQFLTDPEMQLSFLDQTGDEDHQQLLSRIRRDHELFLSNHREFARLVKQNEHRESRMKTLETDISELRKANIAPGEAALLLEKRKKLSLTEKQAAILSKIREQISGKEGKESALSMLKEASDNLKILADQDESVKQISEQCESLYYELEEIAYQISLKYEHIEAEPDILEKTDNRLDIIHRLERKHSRNADDLSVFLYKLEEEYKELEDLEEKVSRMSSDHKKLLAAYRNTARELTASRRKLAIQFEQKMMKELDDLGMGNTQFRVEFRKNDTGRPLMPTPNGDDRIDFMISPNPGEPLKPLSRIASGGELSRLMLAVKTLESSHSGVDSMVFDEIDTGISGTMAQVVADKMIMISRRKQVICVTHLPQIAAAADYHYIVCKNISGGRTHTSVTELDRDGRTEEVGRMISGADGITNESRNYASRMLRAAVEIKQKKLHID